MRGQDGGWPTGGRAITDLLSNYDAECAQSRRIVARLTLDTMQRFTPPQFAPVSVRWILTHMIEETARHLDTATDLRRWRIPD